jgi:hypothetical protein
MRDIEGRYLSSDVVESVNSFLLERGCKTVNGIPNITNIHLTGGFYKTEFTEPDKSDIGYIEIPEHWVKSFIRNKKIDKLIEKRS